MRATSINYLWRHCLIVLISSCNSHSSIELVNGAKKIGVTAASDTTLKITPTSLTFGSVALGTSFTDQNVSILNTASTPVFVSDMAISDSVSVTSSQFFSVNSGTCSASTALAAGGICSVVIRLKPATITGNISAVGTVSYGGSVNDKTFSTTINISATIVLGSTTVVSSTAPVNPIQISGSQLTSSSQTVLATTAITPIDINVTSTGNDFDSHGGVMTYACTFNSGTPCSGLPNIAYSFNTATGILNWTPSTTAAPASNTTYTFTVTATDSTQAVSTVVFTITVLPKVVLTTFANRVFPSTFLDQGSTLNLDWNNIATGTDAGVTYSCVFDQVPDGVVNPGTACTSLPGTATFNTTTGILAWTPDAVTLGSYELKITGTGATTSDIKYLVVSVRQPYTLTNLIGDWDAAFAALLIPNSGTVTTWNDLTTFANIGNLTATTISWPGNGLFSNPYALAFAGAEYIDFGSAALAGITRMMFSTWIKPTAATAVDTVIVGNSSDSTGNGFTLRQSKSQSGKLELTIGKTYQDVVLADNPVGYWRLGETSGTNAKNIGSNGIDGTYGGGFTLAQSSGLTGSSDFSTGFDGVSGSVNFTNPASLQLGIGTMEAWVKTTDSAVIKGILVKQSAYSIFIAGGKMAMYDWTGNMLRDSGAFINDNIWHHVAASFQSGVVNGTILYVDGAQKLATTMAPNNQGNPLLAASGNAGGQYIIGSVQETAVYNTILTPAQILAHYNAGIGLTGGSCRTTSTFSNSLWNNIAGIFNGGNLSLFVNGQQECTTPSVPAVLNTAATNLIIGATAAGSNTWSGASADLKVYGTSNGTTVGTATNANTNFTSTADRFRATKQGNITKTGLVFNVDAANAVRGLAFPGLGCAVTSWFELSLSALNGTLTNFAGCGATTGWNGDGATSGAGTTGPYQLTFNGTNNYLNVPYNSLVNVTSGISIGAWIKTTQVTTGGIVSRMAGSPFAGYGLVLKPNYTCGAAAGQFGFWVGDDTTKYVCTTGTVHDGNWHYLTGTYDGTTAKTYIDGLLDGSGARTNGLNNVATSLTIGTTAAGFFTGSVAATQIYNRALSQAEITSNCKATQSRFAGVVCN